MLDTNNLEYKYGEECFKVVRLEQENARLIQALEDVVNPIGKIKREMPENCEIDIVYAQLLSNDIHHIKSIAKEALDKKQQIPPLSPNVKDIQHPLVNDVTS
jgi:hypothetical protein